MKRKLSTATVEKAKPRAARYEISDLGSPGLRLIVQPTGARSWAMRFRRPGGRIAKLTLGPYKSGKAASGEPVIGGPLTLAEARQVAAEVNRRRAAKIDVIADRRTLAATSADAFPIVAREFIEGHRVRKTGERPRNWRLVARVLGLGYPVAPASIVFDPKVRSFVTVVDKKPPEIIKGGLCDRWATRPIGEISGHDVHAVITEAIKHGTPGLESRTEEPSDNRGRKMADALGSLFKWAMRHRRAAMKAGSPMAGTYRPGPPKARDRMLSDTEIAALWAACDDLDATYAGVVRLLLLTGCRLNEIASLEWREIADDLSAISLPPNRTKNSLPHVVHLAPMARRIIEGQKRIEGSEFVFSITGKPVSNFQLVKRTLDQKMKTAAPWVLHDLRRSAATGMAELGIAPHIVEAVLNHISGARAGVAGVYNRALYSEEKRHSLARWADHIAGIIDGKSAKVVGIEAARQRRKG